MLGVVIFTWLLSAFQLTFLLGFLYYLKNINDLSSHLKRYVICNNFFEDSNIANFPYCLTEVQKILFSVDSS